MMPRHAAWYDITWLYRDDIQSPQLQVYKHFECYTISIVLHCFLYYCLREVKKTLIQVSFDTFFPRMQDDTYILVQGLSVIEHCICLSHPETVPIPLKVICICTRPLEPIFHVLYPSSSWPSSVATTRRMPLENIFQNNCGVWCGQRISSFFVRQILEAWNIY